MQKIPVRLIKKMLSAYQYKITLKRIANAITVLWSIFLGQKFKSSKALGSPLLLMVEPTNICNLKCPMCPSGAGEMTRPKGKMDFALFKKAVDEIGDGLILIQFWNQGEPFINPSFLDMVTYAKSKGIPAMTSTNGHFIKSKEDAEAVVLSGLDEIIISVDGLDQDTYAAYRRGGNLQTVLNGIRYLSQAKKDLKSKHPLINLQFLIMKHNESQKMDMIETAKQLGADIIALKSAQVYNEEQAQSFLPDDDTFSRYRKSDQGYQLKGTLPDWCQFLWHGAVLNWDGDLTPCCFDKDAAYAWGNLTNQNTTFMEIWKSDKAKKFRASILNNRSQYEICRNCFEGMPQDYVQYQVL